MYKTQLSLDPDLVNFLIFLTCQKIQICIKQSKNQATNSHQASLITHLSFHYSARSLASVYLTSTSDKQCEVQHKIAIPSRTIEYLQKAVHVIKSAWNPVATKVILFSFVREDIKRRGRPWRAVFHPLFCLPCWTISSALLKFSEA